MPLRRISVKSIMTPDVPKVGPDAAVGDIVDKMTEKTRERNDMVVVIDESGAPLGVVTERDVMAKLLAEGSLSVQYLKHLLSGIDRTLARLGDLPKWRARTARDLMSSPAVCIEENASVVDLAVIMTAKGLRQLPVVREGLVTGLVRRSQVVKAMAELYPTQAEE